MAVAKKQPKTLLTVEPVAAETVFWLKTNSSNYFYKGPVTLGGGRDEKSSETGKQGNFPSCVCFNFLLF